MTQELPYEEIPYETPFSKLSPLQAKVAIALAHGGTLSEVANSCGIHRVTIYRWMKSLRVFETAVEQERAEYALALRDDLRELSERALRTLSAILDDPRASASTRARVAMFIMQRNESPRRGWALPVSLAPLEDRNMEPDSPLIAEDERHIRELEAQMATPEPAPPASDATPCSGMQHDAANFQPAPCPQPVPLAPGQRPPAAQHDATECNTLRDFSCSAPPPRSLGAGSRADSRRIFDNLFIFNHLGFDRPVSSEAMQRDATECNTTRQISNPAPPQCYPDI
jgi:AcrR family transcriptional regulator